MSIRNSEMKLTVIKAACFAYTVFHKPQIFWTRQMGGIKIYCELPAE